MITTLTAFTHEIDDAAEATAEILAQLDLEHNLKQNSVGILTCYSEFVESGVVQNLCANGRAKAQQSGHRISHTARR